MIVSDSSSRLHSVYLFMGIFSETGPAGAVGLLDGFNVDLLLGEEDGFFVLEFWVGAVDGLGVGFIVDGFGVGFIVDGFGVGCIVDGFEVGLIVDGFGVGCIVGAGFLNGLPSYHRLKKRSHVR